MRIKRPVKGWFRIHRDIIVIDRAACLYHVFMVNDYLKEKGSKTTNDQESEIIEDYIFWLEKKFGTCVHEKHDLRAFDNELQK